MKDKDIDKILKSIIILIDSRERNFSHIKLYLKQNKIPYEIKKLNFADYSFRIPEMKEFGIEETSFEGEIAIERKANAEELSGNFTQGRDRFKREFERGNGKIRLLIENTSYKDISTHNYDTDFSETSYKASLHTFCERYNAPFMFCDKSSSGEYIYNTFYYYLRHKLKNI